MHSYNNFDHGWWGMGAGMFMMLMVVVLAVIGVFAILKWMTESSRSRRQDMSGYAEACLKERFARGEIDEDTFQRQLDEIRKG